MSYSYTDDFYNHADEDDLKEWGYEQFVKYLDSDEVRSIHHYRRYLEDRAIGKISQIVKAEFGYRSSRTKANAPFDMVIEGLRVEVKAAAWHDSPKGGRYQANIRNHKADLVIFDCINGTDHFHIIPMAVIVPRKALAVWSYDPSASSGQWVGYLENWDYLTEAVAAANSVWQPPLL